MNKQAIGRQRRQPAGGSTAPFDPVPVRARHDGWTPVRQIDFIKALAETANVEEACRLVGMSAQSAYVLRGRADAASLRQAWDLALDYGVTRLGDAMLGRALYGVATPIFYKGEQVGERRHYDERLAIFIMRARQPERYGKWRDGVQETRSHADGAALLLQQSLRELARDGAADLACRPRQHHEPLKTKIMMDDPAEIAALEEAREREEQARCDVEWNAYLESLDARDDAGISDLDSSGDVATSSSTSESASASPAHLGTASPPTIGGLPEPFVGSNVDQG